MDSPRSHTEPGTLYLVPTPIGNLADMTYRAVAVLREVDVILCEDTRRARIVTAHYGIAAPLVRFDEHTEQAREERVLARLRAGERVALTSDAGMPLVSDPGYPLVRAATAAGLPVVALPGASAGITALAASGLPPAPHVFWGFVAGSRAKLAARLAQPGLSAATLIFYVAPHDAARLVATLGEVLGERPAVLARELTKMHEEYRRGTLAALAASIDADPPRGECVLLVGPGAPPVAADPQDVRAVVVQARADSDLPDKELARLLAVRLGLRRKAVYEMLLGLAQHDGKPPGASNDESGDGDD